MTSSTNQMDTTTLYFGGDIITLNEQQPSAEALAVKNGRILAVGDMVHVREVAGDIGKEVNLEGRTLVPGFIDSHSHVSMVATKLECANLSRDPMGPVNNIDDLIQQLNTFKDTVDPTSGDWIIGMGYDPSHMEERRHPTRYELDKVSTDYPVMAVHFSGHIRSVNSKLLEMAGISADTLDQEGGHIQRMEGSNEPSGVLEELAGVEIQALMPKQSLREKIAGLKKACSLYYARGYTTIQDGAIIDQESYEAFLTAADEGLLKGDVVGYPFYPFAPELMDHYHPGIQYHHHFRIGGAKLVLDGGLPGYTAFLRDPYFKPLPGMAADYRAYPFFEDQNQINGWVDTFYQNDWPYLVHALGDAAIDQFLEAVATAQKKYPDKKPRPVLVHAIIMQEDQLDSSKDLGVVISFFSAHNYIFGDFHVSDTVGPERGSRINPAASALRRGIIFTIHHDAPITPVDQIFLIWTAVNRIGESGQVHGPEQQISPLEALKASTINAAYQYFEEDIKGSLEIGKLADMVILSQNPLTVDPMAIRDIAVMETIKEGNTIFRL